MRYILLLLAFVGLALGQTATPNISNITNAALPTLDQPPASIALPGRSMATILGENLADSTLSAVPPWPNTLGGTEVHLASDTCFDVSCDLVAGLIYVSPTQINFVVPDDGTLCLTASTCRASQPYRVVLVRDGQRFDDRSFMIGGPGNLTIDSFKGDYEVVFQMGYECLYSYSLTDPTSCGLSWNQGPHRALLGAVTDAISGQLLTTKAPVHQGQIITLWFTGLTGNLTIDSQSGFLEQTPPLPVNFGVAQLGQDVTGDVDFGLTGPYSQYGILQTAKPLWVGESPQIVGLDQMNVAFPTCPNSPAISEKHYDAFMLYGNGGSGETVRLYLPFIVRPGDPDCFGVITPPAKLSTTTTLTSSVNPIIKGQAIIWTIAVSPSTVTGTVTVAFTSPTSTVVSTTWSLSGGTLVVNEGTAFNAGTYLVTATYNGDGSYAASTGTLNQVVLAQ